MTASITESVKQARAKIYKQPGQDALDGIGIEQAAAQARDLVLDLLCLDLRQARPFLIEIERSRRLRIQMREHAPEPPTLYLSAGVLYLLIGREILEPARQ